MKKIGGRAISLVLIAALVICGMGIYILRYIDHGGDWALYFSKSNSGSTGELIDRNGEVLASFISGENHYAESELRRLANYHVTGDYWGRTGTGVLSNFYSELQGFSLLTGTTKPVHSTMQLNIDTNLNELAYQALGGRNGAVLMQNYKTGELLCMVSTPAIDPAAGDIENPPDGAYVNRCISAAFTPGSVFKLITAAAAIEQIADIYEREFYCPGYYTVAGVDINCSGTHYTQSFEQSLANSCNVAFAQIAIMLGHDTMIDYVKEYGFLDSHSLGGIPTTGGNYPTEFIGDPELAWSGIGQSTDLVCPYSLLRFVSAAANEGVLCEPKLFMDGKHPEKSRFMPASTAEALKELMSYAAFTHYNSEANFPGLNICAKTGTAEVGDGTSHAWFAGFLADEEHPYAFVVLVEHGGGGLSAAGTIANRLLQAAVS